MASENRRFVQFPHPGGEHSPDSGEWKEWNPSRKPHGRKFLEVEGAWLDSLDAAEAQRGKLWAWGEWEPESRVLRRFAEPAEGMPRYLWEPTWLPKEDYRGLHNTDPFIFDGFYYTNCKQWSLPGLRGLGRGSIIVFGSKRKSHWVADTVLVVADYVDHTDKDYEERLNGRVPQCWWDVVASTDKCAEHAFEQRWYRGATYDSPMNGMFSFFPCVPAKRNVPFARPSIELPQEFFTPSLTQGAKGCAMGAGSIAESTLKMLWDSIVAQILAQGLRLGIWAQSPARGVSLRRPQQC